MSTLSLILSSFIVFIPIVVSRKEKLGLERDILWSMARAIIQLIVVGYILNFIFGMQSPIFTVALSLLMVFNASMNTKKKGININNVRVISYFSIFIGTLFTISILVLVGTISFIPNQIIPIAGMIISNSMIALNISYKNLTSSFKNRQSEVEAKLSLGANIKESSIDIIRASVKIALIPTIDSAKTLGIVALPGMMTGLIIAGTSPLTAIKFQIMVTFMILASSTISTIIATYIAYRDFFNERQQLILN